MFGRGSLFEFEWQPAGDEVRAPELAATWARLEIAVDGAYPTIVEDLTNRSIRRSIYVPLYPLAEWIAFNWWGLLFGARSDPSSNSAPLEQTDHHQVPGRNIRGAGDGFIWPNLAVSSDGGGSLLTWRADEVAHQGWRIRFLTSGATWVDTDWLCRSMSGVVEATLARLEEAGLVHTPLQKEWSVLKGLDVEEAAFCGACGRLGLDPFADGQEFAGAIDAVFEKLDDLNRDEFLDAIRPPDIEVGLTWVDNAGKAAATGMKAQGTPPWPVGGTLHPEPALDLYSGPARLYQVGYRQAGAVRKALSLPPTMPLGVADLPVVQAGVEGSPDRSLQALSVISPDRDRAGLVLGWHASEPAKLFASARCAWSLLFEDRSERVLLTAARSRLQRISRAFAAELLAPADGIRELVGDLEPGAWPSSVADHFGVSDMVIEHQIANRL